jgi:heme A synthase
LTLGLVVGAFLLALWVDVRIGESRPESPGRRVGHVVAGFVLLEASVGVLYFVDSFRIPQAAFMAVVLAVFLPALTYSLLTAMWLVRTLVEIARFARR